MALTLTCMRGYPASGKSTRAREIADETGAVVVCRDDLRMMLHGTYHSGKRELEDQVTIAERAQTTAFLKAGVSVIVDATHLEPAFLRKWARLAQQHGAEFVRVDVPTSLLKCQANDLLRKARGERFVGESVITRMAKRYPVEKWPDIQAPPAFTPKPVEWVEGLPEAVIVDIDGTLAHMTGRSPYDYKRVSEDTVDEHVKRLVNLVYDDGIDVLVVSGRDVSCTLETRRWLDDNGVQFNGLYMRPADAKDGRGNKLADFLVKHDLFNAHIRGKYNVRFVVDDRQTVVDMWRRLGLKVLQCDYGDF